MVNDRKKHKVIKFLIQMQKANMVFLQETKVREMSLQLVRSLFVRRFLK